MIKEIRFYFSSTTTYSHFIQDPKWNIGSELFYGEEYLIEKDHLNEVTVIIRLSNVLMAAVIDRPDLGDEIKHATCSTEEITK